MSESISRKEFLERYGDMMVEFHSYYKYSFTFKRKMDNGSVLSVEVGGNHDDIYRFDVVAGMKFPVKQLDPVSGSIHMGKEEIVSFCDPF